MLPETLRKIGDDALHSKDLKVVWTYGNCSTDIKKCVRDSVTVLSPNQKIFGDQRLCDLRALKCVAIPDGITVIGTCWFMDASIESVTISASVKEICADAFCDCHRLHEVVL